MCETMKLDNIIFQYDYEKLLYDNCEGLISKMILKLKDMIRY